MNTLQILTMMGLDDQGDVCDQCGEHSVYVDLYYHEGRGVRKYCPVCAGLFNLGKARVIPASELLPVNFVIKDYGLATM